MNVGQRIKSRRESLGLSQHELAIKCGYSSRAAISMIENSDRGLSMKQAIIFADALECDPMWLVQGTSEYEKYHAEKSLNLFMDYVHKNIPNEKIDDYIKVLIGTIDLLNEFDGK